MQCRLQGVQPTGGQTKWSEEVSDVFNQLVGEPLYNMIVKATGVPLSVELINKETGKSLVDLLIEMKLVE